MGILNLCLPLLIRYYMIIVLFFLRLNSISFNSILGSSRASIMSVKLDYLHASLAFSLFYLISWQAAAKAQPGTQALYRSCLYILYLPCLFLSIQRSVTSKKKKKGCFLKVQSYLNLYEPKKKSWVRLMV